MTALVGREGVNMWVLLSRRSQIKMHLGLRPDGTPANVKIPVPGLMKWCKANIEGCENARTVRDCIVPVETAIAMAGGPQDFSIVNVHVMLVRGGLFHDRGVYNDMSEVEAVPAFVNAYQQGRLEIVYTLDAPREPNGEIYVPA